MHTKLNNLNMYFLDSTVFFFITSRKTNLVINVFKDTQQTCLELVLKGNT